MTDVIVQDGHTVKADGVAKGPGSLVQIKDPDEADRLVACGVVQYASDVAGVSDLPKDLPGRKDLIKAGFSTLEAVREIDDFTDVKGIGESTADAIEAYLAEADASGGDE